MKLVTTLCLLAILGATSRPSAAQDGVAGVYDALTESFPSGCPLTIASHADVSGTSITAARAYAHDLGLAESVAEAFASVNKVSHSIAWNPARLHVERVEATPPLAGDDGRGLLREVAAKHPCVNYIFSFSDVARVGPDAMVKVSRFCGGICGGGSDVVRLRLTDKRWRVTKWVSLSID